MNDSVTIPKWFFIVASIAILWNAMGVMAYLQTVMMTPESLAKMPQAQQDIHLATPVWANAAFAIAVFGGLIGSLLLVLKKSLALPILAISLIAILAQMFNAFFIMNSYDVYGPGGLIMPLMVIIFAVYLVWLANNSKSIKWLN